MAKFLPQLPSLSELTPNDLMLVNRDNVSYKTTTKDVMGAVTELTGAGVVLNTDSVLIGRNNQSYQSTPSDLMASVEDFQSISSVLQNDLVSVTRSNQGYKSTAKQVVEVVNDLSNINPLNGSDNLLINRSGSAYKSTFTNMLTSFNIVNNVGTINSQSKSGNGAVISSGSIVLQTADASNPGLVSTGSQTLAGQKTFNNAPILNSLTANLPLKVNGSKIVTSSAIDLSSAEITGNLPVINLDSGTNATSSTFWRGDGTWDTPTTIANIGTIDSEPRDANGAVIVGSDLVLQTANDTYPGLVSTGSQVFEGTKTFNQAPILDSLTASRPLQLDASKNIISSAIDLSGAQVTGNLSVTHLNSGASASSTTFWRGDGTWSPSVVIGTIDSTTKSANGAVFLNGNLIMQTANDVRPGLVSYYGKDVFTPVLTCASPGDLSVTYALRLGQYIRIGDMVTCFISLITSTFSYSTASGAMKITGLPFTSGLSAGNYATGTLAMEGVNKTGYNYYYSALVDGTSEVICSAVGTGTTVASIDVTDLTSGVNIATYITISYFV